MTTTPKPAPATASTTPAPAAATSTVTGSLHVEAAAQHIDDFAPDVAMRMMKAHVAMLEDVRNRGVGKWEPPSSHPHLKPPEYRFCRLGTMADVKRRDEILRKRFILEQQGWRLAPPGTYNSLWAVDGDQGVYMVIHSAAAAVLDEHERETRAEIKRRRFGTSGGTLPADLRELSMRGLHVEKVDVTQGQMSLADFAGEVRPMRRSAR